MLTTQTNPTWLTSTLEKYVWTNADLAKTFKHCCAIRTLVRSGYVVSGSNWHEICCSGNLSIMEYLLLTGVDVDLRGSSSGTLRWWQCVLVARWTWRFFRSCSSTVHRCECGELVRDDATSHVFGPLVSQLRCQTHAECSQHVFYARGKSLAHH